MANYHWLITYDRIDGGESKGVRGPRASRLTRSEIRKHGKAFRLLDDDGELYYRGLYVGPDDETLFAAARRAGIRLPTLCRNGTCRTCLSQMRSGTVRYVVEWPGLSREEKAQGCILPCVAVAESDIVMENEYAERIG